MKISTQSSCLTNARHKLDHWYQQTRWGSRLLKLESEYLAKTVCAAYNEVVVQIGSLQWNPPILDQASYRKFFVADTEIHNLQVQLVTDLRTLPIYSESVDIVIIPHTLEFVDDQHQLLREVERVLKPEGRLYYLGFLPLSLFGLLHYWPGNRGHSPWCGHFVSQHKMLDRLSLLNFEVKVKTCFRIKPTHPELTVSYAIKAIKRRYTIIPLGSVKIGARLMPATVMESEICKDLYE